MVKKSAKYRPGDRVICDFNGNLVQAVVCQYGEGFEPPLKIGNKKTQTPVLCSTNKLFWIEESSIKEKLGKDFWTTYYH